MELKNCPYRQRCRLSSGVRFQLHIPHNFFRVQNDLVRLVNDR
jgi:hypothetical protein